MLDLQINKSDITPPPSPIKMLAEFNLTKFAPVSLVFELYDCGSGIYPRKHNEQFFVSLLSYYGIKG